MTLYGNDHNYIVNLEGKNDDVTGHKMATIIQTEGYQTIHNFYIYYPILKCF